MYVILEGCDRCGLCIVECGVDAIEKGRAIHRIVPERCTSCAACVPVCPLGVIVAVPSAPKDKPADRPRSG